MKRSKKTIIAAAFIMFLLIPTTITAQSPYSGYVYNPQFKSAPSINGYIYLDSIDGYSSEIGPFKDIQDLFIAADDTIYAVDSGNNRIVRMDSSGKLLQLYGDREGKGQLNGPKGVFVSENRQVYVADTRNNRIAVFSADGHFLREYVTPDSKLLSADFLFLPSKLVVDKRGYLFIASEGFYQGLIQLKPDGEFAGFYGANHVPFSFMRLLTKIVATPEQRAQIAREKPPEFSNLYQDQNGFIYTTTFGIKEKQVKRLSAVGVDTLNTQITSTGRYGDFEMRKNTYEEKRGKTRLESFVDLTVDRNGFITALDQTTGRAFQYDSLGNLLFTFGGIGEQNGLFIIVSSIAVSSDGTIYVSDKGRNRIDRFVLTPFGELVHKAAILYSEGYYQEAEEPWNEVLRWNSNYHLAYLAIGKSYYKQERFEEALPYFKRAMNRKEYSKAFMEYRKEWFRSHFAEIFFSIILLFVFVNGIQLWRRRMKVSKISAAKGRGNG